MSKQYQSGHEIFKKFIPDYEGEGREAEMNHESRTEKAITSIVDSFRPNDCDEPHARQE